MFLADFEKCPQKRRPSLDSSGIVVHNVKLQQYLFMKEKKRVTVIIRSASNVEGDKNLLSAS